MQRIVVFGASGSGKTTLGRWLAERQALPFTDLDDLHWREGWIECPTDEFRAAADAITRGQRWVISGNQSKARDLLWPRADTLVWLDLPLATVLWRSAARAMRDWWIGAQICNGNRQRLWMMVNGRDSLLGYTLRTHHERRGEWPRALSLPEHRHARAFRLRSRAEIAAWQAQLQAGKIPVDR